MYDKLKGKFTQMKSFNYKKDQDKNRSVATDSSSKNSAENSNNFEDNSAEAIQMRQFQANIDESEEVKQMKAYQDATEKHETIQAPNDDPSGSNNNTGLPDKLKTGMENQSGVSLDDVKVHRNSDKPAQLQAHAYAQGSDIYLGAGQEKHLAHELGHVVQQKKGMVKPTMQMKGKVNVNDDALLEKEADVMGQKAFQFVDSQPETNNQLPTQKMVDNSSTQEHKTIQRMQLIATEKDERSWQAPRQPW